MVHNYGGFWRRGLAILIDKTVLYFIFLILILLEFMLLPSHPYSRYPDLPAGKWEYMTGTFMIGHAIVFIIVGAAYFTYFHGSLGQTPGKMLLGLRVIRATGRSMTYSVALLRWAGYLVSSIFLCLGFIWAAFDGRKQAWHDKLAGTLVILSNSKKHTSGPVQLPINF